MSRFSGWRSVTLCNSYPSNHEDEDIFPALGEGVILNNADFTYQITDGENLVQSHQINHECKHHPGNRRGGKRWSKDYIWWMFCRIHTQQKSVNAITADSAAPVAWCTFHQFLYGSHPDDTIPRVLPSLGSLTRMRWVGAPHASLYTLLPPPPPLWEM